MPRITESAKRSGHKNPFTTLRIRDRDRESVLKYASADLHLNGTDVALPHLRQRQVLGGRRPATGGLHRTRSCERHGNRFDTAERGSEKLAEQ